MTTIASATPGANRVPKANAGGKLNAGWMTAAAIISDLGLSGLTAGALLFASGASTVDKLPIGPAGQLLVAGASAPAWSGCGLTFASGTLAHIGGGGVTSRYAASQDGVQLLGRAGGTSGWLATISPTTLTANRTATLPDASITVAGINLAQTWTASQTLNGVSARFTGTSAGLGSGSIYANTTFGLVCQLSTGSSYDGGFLKPDGSAFLWYIPTGTGDVVFPSGSIVVGTTGLAASERARFTGGTAPGTPGGTDVLIGAGQIKAGAGISAATLTATGLTADRITVAGSGGLLGDYSGLSFPLSGSGRTLAVDQTWTDTSGSQGAISVSTRVAPSSASTLGAAGGIFSALSNAGSTGNIAGSTYALAGINAAANHFGSGTANVVIGGVFASAQRSGAGAVGILVGTQIQLTNLSTTTAVNSAMGVRVLAPSDSGGHYGTYRGLYVAATNAGTVNCIGLDIESMTGTGPFAIRTGSGIVSLGDATDATNATTAAVLITGGAVVGKKLRVEDTSAGAITCQGGFVCTLTSDTGSLYTGNMFRVVSAPAAAATYRAWNGDLRDAGTASTTHYHAALYQQMSIQSSGSNAGYDRCGMFNVEQTGAGGTRAEQTAVFAQTYASAGFSSGTITLARTFFGQILNSGAGAITTGVLLDLGANAGTTKYAIRSLSTSGIVSIGDTSASTASNNGAFVVAGGAGIGGAIFGGSNATFAGDVWANSGHFRAAGSVNPYISLNDGTGTSFIEVATGLLRLTPYTGQLVQISGGTMATPGGTAVNIAAGAISCGAGGTFAGTVTVPNGTAAAPGIRTTTYAHGLYSIDSANVGVTVAGTLSCYFSKPNGSTAGGRMQMDTPTAGERAIINPTTTASYLMISGDSGLSGGGLRAYGSAHATLANVLELTTAGSARVTIDAVGDTTFSGRVITSFSTYSAAAILAQGTYTLAANQVASYTSGLHLAPGYTGAFTVTQHQYMLINSPSLAGGAAVTDAMLFYFNQAAGTHKALDAGTTKTSPGTVSGWIKINIAGTVHYIPAYTSKTT